MGKGGYGLTYQEVYEMENLTIEAKAIYGMLCSYAGSKVSECRFYLQQIKDKPDKVLQAHEFIGWCGRCEERTTKK